MSFADLNNLSYPQLRDWLKEALHGRAPLPKFTPDEPPDVAIMGAEDTLDKPTRRDLEKAGSELVHELTQDGGGTPDYADALLRLAVRLDIKSLAGTLAAMAEKFSDFPDLDIKTQQSVLLALVDLKVTQPVAFWEARLTENPQAFAGAALSGLLLNSWQAGICILGRLPDEPIIAAATNVILDQTLEDLSGAQRADCLDAIRTVIHSCQPSIKDALHDLLEERAFPIPALELKLDVLNNALRKDRRFLGPVKSLGQSRPARLVPQAA